MQILLLYCNNSWGTNVKKFFRFLFNLLIYSILTVSFIYLLANAILYLLPTELQLQVIRALKLSKQTMLTLTTTASVNVAILLVAKFGQKQSKLALHKKLAEVNAVLEQTNNLNDKVAEKTGRVLQNQQVLEELLFALLEVQKVNVERNLKASKALVQESEKEGYIKALERIEKAIESYKQVEQMQAVITTTKEVVIEKVVEPKEEGRV